jgi:hypothetical protein
LSDQYGIYHFEERLTIGDFYSTNFIFFFPLLWGIGKVDSGKLIHSIHLQNYREFHQGQGHLAIISLIFYPILDGILMYDDVMSLGQRHPFFLNQQKRRQ